MRLVTRSTAPPSCSVRPTQSNSAQAGAPENQTLARNRRRCRRSPTRASIVAPACQVDQADHLLALVAEHMARHMVEPRLAPRFLVPDTPPGTRRCAPPGLGQRVLHHRAAVRRPDRQEPGARIEHRAQQGDPRVPLLAHEVVLRQPGRRRRVEPGIALRQGEGAVPRDAAAFFHRGGLDGLGRQTLHREAVQILDSHVATPLAAQSAPP